MNKRFGTAGWRNVPPLLPWNAAIGELQDAAEMLADAGYRDASALLRELADSSRPARLEAMRRTAFCAAWKRHFPTYSRTGAAKLLAQDFRNYAVTHEPDDHDSLAAMFRRLKLAGVFSVHWSTVARDLAAARAAL
jgi:hypothetical protein